MNQLPIPPNLKKLFTSLAAVLLSAFFFTNVNASHTMGGDFTYKFISANGTSLTYEVTLIVYRDCSSTTKLDNTIRIKCFYAHNNTLYQDLTATLISSKKVLPSCIDSTVACIEQGIYRRQVTLTSSTASGFYGFNLVWARCCRNNNITNLTGNQGQLWSIFIPTDSYRNTSVQYLNLPIPFLCRGIKSTFNLNAYDPNGDSLVFRLVRPYRGGNTGCATPNETGCSQADLVPPYKVVNYNGGYNVNSPFGNNGTISINPSTGEITAQVNANGNYVIAIEVEEFRQSSNGTYVSMGKTRRDLQYIVRVCPANEAPYIDSAYSAGFDKQVIALQQVCFNVRTYDLENDSVFTSKSGAIFDSIQGLKAPYASFPDGAKKGADTVRFCWAPGCHHVSESPYIMTVFAEDNKCNSRQRTYSIKVFPKDITKTPTLHCTEILNDTSVRLTFKPPTDTVGIYYYRVFRQLASGGAFSFVDSVYSTSASIQYTDTKATNANTKKYNYYITSANACGVNSPPSDTVGTLQLNFAKASPGKGTLNWDRPDDSIAYKYKISEFIGSAYQDVDSLPDTSYYLNRCIVNNNFRVYAKTTAGCNIVSNPVSIWLTPSDSVPPAAPKVKFVNVQATNTIKLEWHKSDSPYVKYYEVWRSQNGGAFSMQSTLTFDTAYTDAGLSTKANFYRYYIIAKDSCPSANQSLPSDTVVTIKNSLSTYACVPLVKLNWTVAPHFDGPILNQDIERSAGGGAFASIKTVGPADTSYVDSTVSETTLYHYRVKATATTTAFTSYSDTLGIVPQVYPPPTAPQIADAGVSITGNANGKTLIRWNRVPLTDTFARNYLLYHALDSAGPYTQIADKNNLNDTSFVDSLLNTQNQHYYYQLKVKNLCNFISDSTERHGTIVLNATGGNLDATINWTAYKGWPVNTYRIYRGITPTVQQLYDSVAGSVLTYTDTKVSCGVNYYYKVEATGAQNNKPVLSMSNTDTASVYDIIPPPAISIVRASVVTTGIGNGQVVLNWDASTEINRSGYKIYRSEAGGAYVLDTTLYTTSTGTQTYLDENLNTSTQTNSYFVRVIDSCGNESVASDIHTVADIAAVPGFGEIVISWTPYVGFANYNYLVMRKTVSQNWDTLATLPKDSLKYSDKGTLCQTRYYYKVLTVNTSNGAVFSYSDTTFTDAFDTIPPKPPYMVRATFESPTVALAQWSNPPDLDVKSYELQRARKYTHSWKTIYKTTTDTAYFDSTLNAGQLVSYCYRVIATDLCDNVSEPGNIGCLFTIRGNAKDGTNQLAWESYTDWPMGIMEYRIYRSENGQLYMPVVDVDGNILNYNDSLLSDTANLFCYYVEAQENLGGFAAVSVSNQICLTQKATYLIPNSFTPGHSGGLNDRFGPQGSFIADVKMEIFDRWGRLVYNNPKNDNFWYGYNNNGGLCNDGVYMYQILIYNFDGTKTIARGTVTLLR